MKNMSKIIFKILGFIIISFGYYFLNLKFSFSIPCVFYKITGFYCPGCGITRMFFSILRFDFYQAFRFNPFVFILIITYLLYFLIYIIVKLVKKKEIIICKKIYYILVVLAVIFGILRNIDYFSFLAPTLL